MVMFGEVLGHTKYPADTCEKAWPGPGNWGEIGGEAALPLHAAARGVGRCGLIDSILICKIRPRGEGSACCPPRARHS